MRINSFRYFIPTNSNERKLPQFLRTNFESARRCALLTFFPKSFIKSLPDSWNINHYFSTVTVIQFPQEPTSKLFFRPLLAANPLTRTNYPRSFKHTFEKPLERRERKTKLLLALRV